MYQPRQWQSANRVYKKELPKNRTDSQSTAHPLIKVGEGPMPAPEVTGVGPHPD